MAYRDLFSEGYRACARGKSNIDNPYVDDGDSEAWNDGWLQRLDDENEAAEGSGFMAAAEF
jgi:ribosome modulation factor